MVKVEFDLYFDESGTFRETSTNPDEVIQARRESRGEEISQLAGLLTPTGYLTTERAEAILASVLRPAGLQLQEEFHATEIKDPGKYSELVSGLVDQLQAQEVIQAFRMVNQERVSYGKRVANYTHIVSEMLIRIFQEKLHELGNVEITINLYVPPVVLEKRGDAYPLLMNEPEYKSRIEEYLAFHAVRKGYAIESSRWKLGNFEFKSGKRDRRMQICDLISNASYRDFRRCTNEQKLHLQCLMGKYNFSLVIRPLIERIEELAHEGSIAQSLKLLAERSIENGRGDVIRGELAIMQQRLILDLSSSLVAYRQQQFNDLTSWLVLLERRRELEKGEKISEWLIENCVRPIRESNPDIYLDGFEFSIRRWQLPILNHKGDLKKASMVSSRMDELAVRIAGRWEFAQVLMEALVVQAVHLTDCFDFEAASDKAGRADAYHMQLAKTFGELYKIEVKADGRGKALNTWAQSDMYASLLGKASIQDAREINELAIEQFESADEKNRLFQYRCQIETMAGEFEQARIWLSKSLQIDGTNYENIAQAIVSIDEKKRNFLLLHWLRMGEWAWRLHQKQEFETFLAASNKYGLLKIAAAINDKDYPANGILRRAAFIYAAAGQTKVALNCISRLREITAGPEQLAIMAILISALIEVAGLIEPGARDEAVLLLNKGKGAIHLLDIATQNAQDRFPAYCAVLSDIKHVANNVLKEEMPWSTLVEAGSRIGY